jgi:hypothetical protein
MDKDELDEVETDRTHPMRVCDMNKCNMMRQKSVEALQCASTRVRHNFKVIIIYHGPKKTSHNGKLSRIPSSRYWICTPLLEVKMHL